MLKINKNYVSPEPEKQDTINNDKWSEAVNELIKNGMFLNNNSVGIDIETSVENDMFLIKLSDTYIKLIDTFNTFSYKTLKDYA